MTHFRGAHDVALSLVGDPAMSHPIRRPLVLIADSHDDSRAMLALLLDAAGYRTAECDGGDGTISHVERLSPDVLLLSTSSRGDTIEIARALRDGEGRSRTQVILLTGHADPEHRARALEAGCSACLLKPVDLNQLVGEISRVNATATDTREEPEMNEDRMHTSADARALVRDCSNSIESAKAALEHARVVSARAEKQVERANRLLERLNGRQRVRATRT
jgi:CheY-like chemotaxis protein